MDRQALIDLLNKDLADEHISVIRYLIHAYQAGEDTALGSMMLSIAREEMWHMDYLADEIGEMGAEPNMVPGVYPHDPTSNASLLRSYIAWEDNLVREYMAQAAKVDKADIAKVLMQQAKESATHSKRFAAMLAKLGPEGEEPLVYEETGKFSPGMTKRLESEMTDEYQLVLQHLRHAFVFEGESCPVSSELELTAMRHMKHLSHFAEELAESGHALEFVPPEIDASRSISPALASDIALTQAARARFAELSQNPEMAEHPGLKTELEHMVYQEEFLVSNVEGLREEAEQPVAAAEPEASEMPQEASEPAPDTGTADESTDRFTVGSLIKE